MLRAHRGALLGSIQEVVEGVLRREIGANDHEYDDLVQSSLERVLTTIGAGKFRGDCPVQKWAATVARCVAVDAIRERTRDRLLFDRSEDSSSLSGLPATDGGPEHLAEMHGALEELERALGRLPAPKAATVYLHDVLGYDLAEIARALGTSVAAAQSRLVRGRQQIFNILRKRRRQDFCLPQGISDGY